MQILLAISPIVLILIGIIGLKKPAMYVSPVVMIYTILIGMFYFGLGGGDVVAQVEKGVIEGLKIIMLLFSSFVILNMMIETTAMEHVKQSLASITKDRRALLIIIGLLVPIFLEGAAGAGSPAAIAAPFLVGLGFNPVLAAMAALLGDATPCSWGGAGLTTITGGQALVDAGISTAAENSAMVGRIHCFGVFIIPLMLTLLVFGRKGLKNLWGYLVFSSVTTAVTMFLFSNFVGPEMTSMGTSIVAIILSIIYLKFVGIKTPEEYIYSSRMAVKKRYNTIQAFAPYLFMLILLPVVRYTFPWEILTKFGYIVWIDCVVFISAYLGSLALRVKPTEFGSCMKQSAKKVFPALITIGALLIVSYIMQQSGMLGILADNLAKASGWLYPAVAVIIGAIGSFISGTGLGSNIMFAPMHMDAAASLGLNPITVFAGQNAAASLGNMICPNNVIAVSITVGLLGQEGKVMKKMFIPFFIILILYMILAMLYTHVIFPV